MMLKLKNSIKPVGTGIVKNFWIYALALFSIAIMLIMIGQFFQSQELKRLQKDLNKQEQTGQQKSSVLQSVQELNESLQKQVSSLKEQLAEAKGAVTSAEYDMTQIQKDLSDTMIITEAQTLYLSGKYKSGRNKLAELNADTLSETVRPLYDAAKKLLK